MFSKVQFNVVVMHLDKSISAPPLLPEFPPVLLGSWDSSVVRVSDSCPKDPGFESQQERRENCLLQGQLSVPTLFFGVRFVPLLPQ